MADTVSNVPTEKPLLIYDGECSFCCKWIGRWKKLTGDHVEYAPYQDVADDYPEIPKEDFQGAVQLVTTKGEVFSQAAAVFRVLGTSRRKAISCWLYHHVPPFTAAANAFYRFVARHRMAASRITTLLWGRDVNPPEYRITASMFLRCLGFVYFLAIASLWVQIEGLVGSNGILPIAPLIESLQDRMAEGDRWSQFPTLCWISASDTFLHVQCALGVVFATLLMFGLLPSLSTFALWLIYLSLTMAGQRFLGFQWDMLLIETGLLAIFLFPPHLRLTFRKSPLPSKTVIWLLRWLIFRLMFTSAIVKIASRDVSWWPELTAMTFHYETTCIPTWTSWFMHHLPLWFHKVECAGMFAVEFFVPFLILFPRRLRLLCFWSFALLMIMIEITGNYGYFNLLTITISIAILDDACWPARFKWRAKTPQLSRYRRFAGYPWAVLTTVLAFVVLTASIPTVVRQCNGALARYGKAKKIEWPDWVQKTRKAIGPFRAVNGYGLFAHMTKTRPEIIVEGSNDGQAWEAYEFKWKPGDLSRRPRFVAPHQPRVDWQMWFAALGKYQGEQWFMSMMGKLLEGSPEVLALLDNNPFPDAPPKYIRATLFDYQYSDAETRKAEGVWWEREPLRPYCPVLSLRPPK